MEKLEVKLPHKKYPIMIQNGLINEIPDYLKQKYPDCRIAIVTDDNVNKYIGSVLYRALKDCGYDVSLVELPAGESSKSSKQLNRIYSEFINFGISRSDLILAVGGGVVGDITGFAASTFLRGVKFIQVPTSLLAMVDSSVGGKVAINLPEGKNLVGSFYHPEEVFIDPEVLSTLPDKYFKDGMAEVIKYGCIADLELFNYLAGIPKEEFVNSIGKTIYRCCDIKRDVVQKDEKDTGWRMILNFGHTFGHAVEKYYEYKKYTHGEAVAIGMVKMSEISENLGITKKGTCQEIRKVCQKFNLPIDLEENISLKELFKITTVDKKVKGKKINVVFIKEIGSVLIKTYSLKEWEDILT